MNKFMLNVALAGQHYCRIELPESIETEAVAKAKVIAEFFGEAYDCSLTCWNNVGRQVKI
jgi:hypothetical protein